MKQIKGHRAWNRDEVIRLLDQTGTLTCCTLPHPRVARVQTICQLRAKRGVMCRAGTPREGINVVPTVLFRPWQTA